MDTFNDPVQHGAGKGETDSQADDFRINPFTAGQSQFPQFGESASIDDIQSRIQAAKSNGWGSKLAGFIGSNKKRIFVLAAIIALFAASSYLSDKANQNAPGEEESAGIAGISQNTPDILESDENAAESKDIETEGPKPLDIQLGNDGKVITNGEENESRDDRRLLTRKDESASSITVSTQKGEGITHLARHALTEHLKNEGKTFSPEQKIYAEDYIQNKTGSEMLEIDQKLSFSTDLLKEAVQKSEALEDWQIENLKQYTMTVSLL